MFLRHEFKEGVNFAKLSRKDDGERAGGGAIIAKTKQTLLVGTWNKELEMFHDGKSKGRQNTGDCEKSVLDMAKLLISEGY